MFSQLKAMPYAEGLGQSSEKIWELLVAHDLHIPRDTY